MIPALLGVAGGLVISVGALVVLARLSRGRFPALLALSLLGVVVVLLSPPSGTVGVTTALAGAVLCTVAGVRLWHEWAAYGRRWRPAPLALWWLMLCVMCAWLAGYPLELGRVAAQGTIPRLGSLLTTGAMFTFPLLIVGAAHVAWTRTVQKQLASARSSTRPRTRTNRSRKETQR